VSTAQLFNIPKTPQDQGQWTLANAASHQFIVEQLQAQKPGMTLVRYVLDPVSRLDVQNFLLRHQLMHNQMDELLGIKGNDYSSLDPTSGQAIETIWQQHANEHIQAETKLRSTT
jgi:hypothetical protein